MDIFTEELQKFIESKLSNDETIELQKNKFIYVKKETSQVFKIKCEEVKNRIFDMLKEYGCSEEILKNLKIEEFRLLTPVKTNEEEDNKLVMENMLTSRFKIMNKNDLKILG